jgi:hypothetical protein
LRVLHNHPKHRDAALLEEWHDTGTRELKLRLLDLVEQYADQSIADVALDRQNRIYCYGAAVA